MSHTATRLGPAVTGRNNGSRRGMLPKNAIHHGEAVLVPVRPSLPRQQKQEGRGLIQVGRNGSSHTLPPLGLVEGGLTRVWASWRTWDRPRVQPCYGGEKKKRLSALLGGMRKRFRARRGRGACPEGVGRRAGRSSGDITTDDG